MISLLDAIKQQPQRTAVWFLWGGDLLRKMHVPHYINYIEYSKTRILSICIFNHTHDNLYEWCNHQVYEFQYKFIKIKNKDYIHWQNYFCLKHNFAKSHFVTNFQTCFKYIFVCIKFTRIMISLHVMKWRASTLNKCYFFIFNFFVKPGFFFITSDVLFSIYWKIEIKKID